MSSVLTESVERVKKEENSRRVPGIIRPQNSQYSSSWNTLVVEITYLGVEDVNYVNYVRKTHWFRFQFLWSSKTFPGIESLTGD